MRVVLIRLLSVLAMLALCSPALALQPPRPGERENMQAQGTWDEAVARAEKLGNHLLSVELLANTQQRAREGMLLEAGLTPKVLAKMTQNPLTPRAPPSGWRNLPTKGSPKMLALLIDFADQPAGITASAVNDKLFGAGIASEAPYESLTKYYERESYGKLRIQGTTIGWYRSAQTRAQIDAQLKAIQAQRDAGTITNDQAYVQEAVIRENLIKAAMQSVDATTDFSEFDNNDDGKIDGLVVIYAGPPGAWSTFWWAYKTGAYGAAPLGDGTFLPDGVGVGGYVFEFLDGSGKLDKFEPNVTIHETGHMLGMPDLYDYNANVGPDGGVGGMDMMDGTKGGINCFFKWMMDWTTPTILGGGYKFHDLKPSGGTSDREAVVMMPGAQANGWLNDDFSTDAGFETKWGFFTNPIPQGGAAVVYANQRVEITGRGHFYTVRDFNPDVLGGVKVAGKWTFNAGGDDFFQALTRSDGMPAGAFGETANGVEFFVHMASGNLVLRSQGASIDVQQITAGSVGPIANGTSWNFEIFDDKDTGLAFRFSKADEPARTATVVGRVTRDVFPWNRICFHNREGSGNVAFLDDVAVIPGPSATDLFSEFYMIENRSRAGNDGGKDWPDWGGTSLNFSGGLAIWHVDGRLTWDGSSFAWNNASTNHKLLRLMEADGLEQIESGGAGDGGDFWKPGQSFDHWSTPNSRSYANAFTGIAVTPIRNYKGTITSHFSFWNSETWRRPSITLTTPANGAATNSGSISVSATSTDLSQDGSSHTPIVEFYRDTTGFSRTDNLPEGQSIYNATMNLPAVRSYLLSGFAQDWNNYPLVLASFPQVNVGRVSLVDGFPPVNSFWSTATPLAGNAVNLTAYNTSNNAGGPGAWVAPDESDDPAVSAQSNQSVRVWWKWTAPSDGSLTVTTAGSNFDTVLAVYSGTQLDALREVGSNDDTVGTTSRLENVSVSAGAIYSVMVSGYNAQTGTINLGLTFTPFVPGNDQFASTATVGTNYELREGGGLSTGSTANASAEVGEPSGAQYSVWYRFSPSKTGRLVLNTVGSTYDTHLRVYRGSAATPAANSFATLTMIGENDDNQYMPFRISALGVPVTAGEHYYVQLSGWSSSKGDFNLRWFFAERTANRSPSVTLLAPEGTITRPLGSTLTLDAQASDNDGFVTQVKFFSNRERTALIGSVYFNQEARYSLDWSPAPGGYEVVMEATDDEGAISFTEPVIVNITDRTLAQQPVVSDDCAWLVREYVKASGQVNSLADADALISSGATIQRTWYSRTINFADPASHGTGLLDDASYPPVPFATDNLTASGIVNGDDNDFVTVAWCQFSIPTSGFYTFGFSSDDGARLRLYGGAFISSTRLNPANPANPAHNVSTLQFDANTGNSDTLGVAFLPAGTYGLEFTAWERNGGAHAECFMASGVKTAMDASFQPVGAQANFLIRPPGGPSNDALVDARLLSDAAPSTTGRHTGATREPIDFAGASGDSVWMAWTAPSTGRYQMDTLGSNFDTVLAVYFATGMQFITSDNDGAGALFGSSRLILNATAGTSYRIAVLSADSERPGGSDFYTYDFRITPLPPLFEVINLLDSGAGSLRDTLAAAPAGAIVTFASNLTGGLISLGSEIILNKNVTIDASSLTGLTIHGGAGSNRIFTVNSGQTVTLKKLSLTGGGGAGTTDNGNGGAVHNSGTLTMEDCHVAGNTASRGAGVCNAASAILTLTRCSVAQNISAVDGGGIFLFAGTATLTHCTIAANTCAHDGAGLYTLPGSTTTINHCTIASNNSGAGGNDEGGGIHIRGTVNIANSIVAGNTAVLGSDIRFDGGTLNRTGRNFIGSLAGTGLLADANLLAGASLLAPLGEYGGPTQTLAIMPGSPARDASSGSSALQDQRGFPIVNAPDIGAYEAGTPATNYNAYIWETLPVAASVPQHAGTFDYDNDGQTNDTEWRALTNAASNSSVFTHFITSVSQDLVISFPSATYRTYRLRQSDNLTAWTDAPTTDIIGDGSVKSFTVPITGNRRFYTVVPQIP